MFFKVQAERLLQFERSVCRRATHVIAVSEADASSLSALCGISNVSAIPTGVDATYFARLPAPAQTDDPRLVFVGSMDWIPNIEGILWFTREVLPLVRRQIPWCTLTIAGSRPTSSIRKLATDYPFVGVTGTVDDIRPYLWEGGVSIVPIRIGSGTRLKIFESMAAGIPVVSTTVGARGLDVDSPDNIRIADTPEAFASACLHLLLDGAERARQVDAGYQLVRERYTWETVTGRLEGILKECVTRPISICSSGERALQLLAGKEALSRVGTTSGFDRV